MGEALDSRDYIPIGCESGPESGRAKHWIAVIGSRLVVNHPMLRPLYHLNPQHLNTSTPFTSAIQKANAENTITILNETRLIVDWLTWRREVAPEQQRYLNEMTSKINSMRQQAIRQGVGVSDNGWFFVGLSSM
jgi:hypothetical protein